jgi:predicted transcriptional regulator
VAKSENSNAGQHELMRLAAQVVAAYVGNNSLSANQLPELISTVMRCLTELESANGPAELLVPAVPIKKSIASDYIVCLEDGKKLKILKRYLRTNYNMTPEQYRAKWNLPPDYPMVAPKYAAQRSEFAKKIGLGRKRAA